MRPQKWIEWNEAKPGGKIFLSLHELGATGEATVDSIEPCPSIPEGEGNVVTGKFIHSSSGNLLNVFLEDSDEEIGVTDNHPFWSEDRQDYIPAGDLKVGETVRTQHGLRRIGKILPRPRDEPVYNIEVHREHVYLVGSAGTLVHNSCVSLYRVVDAKELADLKNVGKFRLSPGNLEAKQFHFTRKHATEQAKRLSKLHPASDEYFLVRVKVRRDVFKKMHNEPLDQMPGLTVDRLLLAEFNSGITSLKIFEDIFPLFGL